jgi:hypothetical protein
VLRPVKSAKVSMISDLRVSMWFGAASKGFVPGPNVDSMSSDPN